MSKIKLNAKIFEGIESIANRFRGVVDSITSTYLDECKKIDAAGYIPEKVTALKAEQAKEANRKIADARSSSSGLIQIELDKIGDAVRIWAAELPSADLTNMIQTIRNSGIDVNRAEFEALLLQHDGSYWGSKMLAQLATDYGFTYNYPSCDLFNRKITEIKNGCNGVINNYLGDNPAAWDLDPSTDPIKAVIHSNAFAYFENHTFHEQRDFLLNNVSSLYSLADDPITKELTKSKQENIKAEKIIDSYTDTESK